MDRRRKLLIGAGVVGLVAAGVIWAIQQRHDILRRTPAWTDPEQPPEGTAGQPSMFVSPRDAWCAARPGDPGLRSGGRVMRHYPATLVDDPESLVR